MGRKKQYPSIIILPGTPNGYVALCLTLNDEDAMRDWLDCYRSVRERIVRSETSKDKAGALPPAVCAKRPAVCNDQANTALPGFPRTTETQVEVTEVTGVTITFVSDSNIPLFFFRLLSLVLLITRLKNTKVTQMKALELPKQKTRSGRQAKASGKFDE